MSRGIGGALPGRFLIVWNVTIPLRVRTQCGFGLSAVRATGCLSGRRMTQEANTGGRKATGNCRQDGQLFRWSLVDNWPDTGVVPGPEKVLTWVR